MTTRRILIVAGGTGGHISPGIALYEELKAQGAEVRLVMSRKDARFTYAKELDSDILYYSAPPFGKNPFALLAFPIRFAYAVFISKKILKKYSIEAVVGMGGYVSAPMLYAARRKKVPFYLCEQNSVPGKVTRYFSRYAEAVFSTFENARKHLPLVKKFLCTGNPIRKKIFEAEDRERARSAFNMRHCKKVILAIGGSQGAVKINELVVGLKKAYPREFKDVGIIWSTGEFSYETYKKRLQEEDIAGSVFLSPFITNVQTAYRACDIAISRAGAGVMMELAAMGVPSILIPYPFAADNHQDGNADEFAQAGAAIKISNEDAMADKVAPVLLDLLDNPIKLERMRQAALAIAKKNAAADIAKIVMKGTGAVHV